MRTNYIRWNREMERKCLGRALQEYNRNNTVAKKIQDISHKVEESEGTTEDITQNTYQNTEDTNLQASIKDIVKEDEIHKSYTNNNANKIQWNENMLKRCLGTYFSHSQNSKIVNKQMNEARNTCDEVNCENEQDNMDNFKKISWTTISEIDNEDFGKDMESKDENVYSNDENSCKENYDEVDCDNNNSEDNEDIVEKEYETNEEKVENEKVENEKAENEKAENEKADKELIYEKVENEDKEDIDGNDFKDGQNEREDYKNDYDDDYENDYEDSYDYENIYKSGFNDSYAEEVQEDSFYDEYDEDSEPEQYLSEEYDNNSELDIDNNSLDAFDLEIMDRTKIGMNWGNGWDEYNLIGPEAQDVEIPEYIDDYDGIGYGKSVECRIIT